MDNTKDAISSFGEIRKNVNELTNIRNSIKVSLLGNIDNIIRFLQVGAGIISLDLINKNVSNLIGTSKVWIKNKLLVKDIVTTSLEFKLKFLDDKSDEFNCDFLNSQQADGSNDDNVIEDKQSITTKKSKDTLDPIPEYVKRVRPSELKIGDVVYLFVGPIQHYCIVKKITKDTLFVIPITSNVTDFIGYKIEKSRFFHGTAIFSVVQYPIDLAIKKFVIPYDNRTELLNIIKQCDNYLRDNNIISKAIKRKKK